MAATETTEYGHGAGAVAVRVAVRDPVRGVLIRQGGEGFGDTVVCYGRRTREVWAPLSEWQVCTRWRGGFATEVGLGVDPNPSRGPGGAVRAHCLHTQVP